jgi:hypothetical protein
MVIVRATNGLEADQGRRALPAVGADVNAEADFRPMAGRDTTRIGIRCRISAREL